MRFKQTIKCFSLICITLLLLIGCEEPPLPEPPNVTESPNLDDSEVRKSIFDAAIDEADLQVTRNTSGEKIYHAANQEQPYTGWVKNIRKLQQFRDGKKHGIYISWYGNWQKVEQGQYKNGVQDGLWTQWDPVGQTEIEGTYKDGNRDGLWTLWHPNGEKESEITYEKGSVTHSQTENDSSDLAEGAEQTVPLAYVLRKPSQRNAQIGLPEGAKHRLGKGEIKDFQYSPDGNYLVAATAVGIWLYDGRTGEELGVPGYTDYIESIAFSPDGKTFASQNRRTALCLWDTNTGRQKRILKSTGASIKHLRFSPHGCLLASANVNQSINLWNPHTGEHRLRLGGDNMAFSPDGSTLATVSGNEMRPSGNEMRLWDTLTGQHKRTFTGQGPRVGSVLFSPDGTTLASEGKGETVTLWNIRTGQHQIVKSPFSFSPDGKTFARGGKDAVIIANTHTGKQSQILSGHKHRVSCVSFSPDGATLASGDAGGTIYLWDLPSGQPKHAFIGHTVGYQRAYQSTKAITRLSFNPDGTTLVSECEDMTVRLWNIDTIDIGQHKNIRIGDSTAGIYSLSISPDGITLASGSNDGIVRIWDTRTWQRKGTLTGHARGVSALAFSPDSATLASGAWDNTIRLWNPQTGKQKDILGGTGQARPIVSLLYSPDGAILAGGDSRGVIHLWDGRTRQKKRTLKGHTGGINGLSFSRDGRTLASGGRDKTIHLWDVETGERKKTITAHTHYVSSVLFSPDGKTLASGSWDDTIRLWDAHTGEYKKGFVWDTVSTLAFSPDGKTLASGGIFSRRNSLTLIALWDVKTGKKKKTFMGHTEEITNLSFTPDGKTLASASEDGTILLWDPTSLRTEQ